MSNRIMIHATGPWAQSAYAKAGGQVGLQLQARGYEVAFFDWNSHRSAVFTWHGMPVYPAGNAQGGADILAGHVKHFKADVVLSISDPWVIEKKYWRQGHDAHVIFWHPCQAEPASPLLVEVMEAADLGLNYSQWGTRVMREAGCDNVQYAPLGIDPATFRPLDRAECRGWFGQRLGVDLDGRFVIGMVAANSSTVPLMRKAFDQNLQAFRLFLDEVDDEAIFYIHTWGAGYPGGFDLEPLVESLDLQLGRHVFFPNQYAYRVGIDDNWMAKMYNALDVLSAATLGEGFGLPILEAQACGVPAVTTDWSSMPELTAYGHVATLSNKQWAPGEMQGWVGMPDVADICRGYELAYRGELAERREAGFRLAKRLTWSNVVSEYVVPALAGLRPVEDRPTAKGPTRRRRKAEVYA